MENSKATALKKPFQCGKVLFRMLMQLDIPFNTTDTFLILIFWIVLWDKAICIAHNKIQTVI